MDFRKFPFDEIELLVEVRSMPGCYPPSPACVYCAPCVRCARLADCSVSNQRFYGGPSMMGEGLSSGSQVAAVVRCKGAPVCLPALGLQ